MKTFSIFKQWICVTLLLNSLLLSLKGSLGYQYIAPENPHIQYTGRINFSDPSAPVLY